jgi:hypothetical protein
VNIVHQFYVEVLDQFPFKGNAIDYQKAPGTWIPYRIFNRPLPGDLVIWNIGMYGHIGICNWTTFWGLNCFEQNNPLGSPAHFQTHLTYNKVIGWLRPATAVVSPSLPHVPLQIGFVGSNLPPHDPFLANIAKYASDRLTLLITDYLTSVTSNSGMFTQAEAYTLVDLLNIKEKFVFIFYPPNQTSTFYATYYYPTRNCCITTCPGSDPRLLAFEMSHQLQTFYNEHRGSNPPVEIVDSNFPSDDLIYSKFNSVSAYYL